MSEFFDEGFEERVGKLFGESSEQPKPDPAPKPVKAAASPDPEPSAPAPAPAPASPKADDKPLVPSLKAQPREEPQPQPDTDEKPPASIKSTKAADDWKRMMAANRERESTLAERIKSLESEVQSAKNSASQPAADPETERLKAEHSQMSEQLRILDVERHPRFQQYFGQKINGALDAAKRAVGEKHAARVEGILKMPEGDGKKEAFRALFDELDEFQTEDVKDSYRQLRSAMQEKESELAKARENSEKISQERQANEQKLKSSYLNAVDGVWKEAGDSKNGIAVFQEREGDAQWNSAVQDRRETAKAFVRGILEGKVSPEQLATGVAWMVAGQPILQSASALARENQELKAQINQLRSATPEAGKGAADHAIKPAEDQATSGDYWDDVFSRAKKELAGNIERPY